MYAFPISEMNPCVYYLQLHLDGQQLVSFKSTDNIDKVINNPMIKNTIIFRMINFIHNVDTSQTKKCDWSSTKWPSSNQEGERYYLRSLLMNVRAPKSYQDLLTFNGEYCTTFRESERKEDCYFVTTI
ncbi:hypothetical protein H5410_039820 [Solanum commersonii]|uniref:Uncharacterized protein n=1 Tax=Solanum commersonii TaxID=4109 RepID=A0A9J5XNA1_SOLCO|nr:hypothetical protein H5410_039820 [Solanum commersonii]